MVRLAHLAVGVFVALPQNVFAGIFNNDCDYNYFYCGKSLLVKGGENYERIRTAMKNAKDALVAANKVDDTFEFAADEFENMLFYCKGEEGELEFQTSCDNCVDTGHGSSDWCPLPSPAPTPTAEVETPPEATASNLETDNEV